MKYNMHIFSISIVAMMVFSCCTHKPVIIEKRECNDAAIGAYVLECIPIGAIGTEAAYYKDECFKQAKLRYCKTKKYLIIRGKQIPCDSVAENLKKFCL